MLIYFFGVYLKARKIEYKDPAQEEWEKFQKALSTENQVYTFKFRHFAVIYNYEVHRAILITIHPIIIIILGVALTTNEKLQILLLRFYCMQHG